MLAGDDLSVPTGAQRIVELLREEGVDRIFGNPGSTELALVEAIVRSGDIAYTLALHEGCVIPMADGYTQATGRPTFVNLHTISGLGNAVGVLANAKANGTPLVVTAGQQDRALLIHGPLLRYDLVSVACPVVKWAAEVRSEAELGAMLRRAFLEAAAPPAGPVFLSLPQDILYTPAPTPLPTRSEMTGPGVAGGMETVLSLLRAARSPAIVAGQELGTSDGSRAIVAVAERLGAPLFTAFNAQRGVVPPRHPLNRGDLPGFAQGLRQVLADHDCLFFVGGQAFQLFGGEPGPILPDGATLIHLAPDASALSRGYIPATRLFGDLVRTLAAITEGLPEAPKYDTPPEAAVSPPAASSRLDALLACRMLIDALPPDAILHNEVPSVGAALRPLFPWRDPEQFYSSKQTIGWAMGAAVGVSLGHGRARKSLALIGDGSAAFSLSALWSAAREKVPVIFAIIDNSGYEILSAMTQAMTGRRTNNNPALQIGDPALDFVLLARGYGVEAQAVDDVTSLADAIKWAMDAEGPVLLHVKLPA